MISQNLGSLLPLSHFVDPLCPLNMWRNLWMPPYMHYYDSWYHLHKQIYFVEHEEQYIFLRENKPDNTLKLQLAEFRIKHSFQQVTAIKSFQPTQTYEHMFYSQHLDFEYSSTNFDEEIPFECQRLSTPTSWTSSTFLIFICKFKFI